MNKKFKSIIKYISLFIIVLIWNLIVMKLSGDETWNFGFSYNISKGLIPYLDFNLVITPLFPFIMSIPLYIFGANMLIFHIVWSLIIIIMLSFIFKLLKEKAWIVFLSLFFVFPIIIPNYNMFIYFITILIIFMEKNNKSDYFIGFLLALTILTKHTVGFFLVIPSIIFYRNDVKKIIKRFIGIIIPISIFVIYLIITKSLYSFIDLCILGLCDFAKENGHLINKYVMFTIISIILLILIIRKDKKNITNYYALAFISIVLPIFDLYHFWIFFSFFIFIYLLNHDINLRLNIKLFVFSLIIFMSFLYLESRFKERVIYPNKINKFEYRFLSKTEINYTNKLINFIKENNGKKIINFNGDAYYIKLVTNKNINYLDLINRGNWGYNGSNRLIKEIKKNKDAIYLVNETDLYEEDNQLDKKALKYIIKNGEKIGSITENYISTDVYILEE